MQLSCSVNQWLCQTGRACLYVALSWEVNEIKGSLCNISAGFMTICTNWRSLSTHSFILETFALCNTQWQRRWMTPASSYQVWQVVTLKSGKCSQIRDEVLALSNTTLRGNPTRENRNKEAANKQTKKKIPKPTTKTNAFIWQLYMRERS